MTESPKFGSRSRMVASLIILGLAATGCSTGGESSVDPTPPTNPTTQSITLREIQIETKNVILGVKAQKKLKAKQIFSDGSQQDFSGEITVANPSKATIQQSSLTLTGTDNGSTVITFKKNGVEASTNVTVEFPGVTFRRSPGVAVGTLSSVASSPRAGSDGRRLLAVSARSGDSAISDDEGLTWTKRNGSFADGANDLLPALVTSNGTDRFVVTKGRRAFRSSNGGTDFSSAAVSASTSVVLTSLVSLGDALVALAGGPEAFRSTDRGQTWTSSSAGLPGSFNPLGMSGDGPGLVAVGIDSSGPRPAIFTSNDGVFWGQRPVPATSASRLRAVASFGTQDPRYVAVGDRGLILISSDSGLNWRAIPGIPATLDFTTVVVDPDNQQFVALGINGEVFRGGGNFGPGGQVFPNIGPQDTIPGFQPFSATYLNGRLVAVGLDATGESAYFTSP